MTDGNTMDEALARLGRMVGSWTTEATHPAAPGLLVRGTVAVEWLEGERFLIHRARTEHPDFPDSISILGMTDRDRVGAVEEGAAPRLTMHYFDSRGVFRVYEASVDDDAWMLWRSSPGLSQRYRGVFADGGDTIAGVWQMCEDDVHWKDDLRITYRRSE